MWRFVRFAVPEPVRDRFFFEVHCYSFVTSLRRRPAGDAPLPWVRISARQQIILASDVACRHRTDCASRWDVSRGTKGGGLGGGCGQLGIHHSC